VPIEARDTRDEIKAIRQAQEGGDREHDVMPDPDEDDVQIVERVAEGYDDARDPRTGLEVPGGAQLPVEPQTGEPPAVADVAEPAITDVTTPLAPLTEDTAGGETKTPNEFDANDFVGKTIADMDFSALTAENLEAVEKAEAAGSQRVGVNDAIARRRAELEAEAAAKAGN